MSGKIELLDDIFETAAIVCGHVAKEGCPIHLAVRSAPEEPEDSGWQFLCNSGKDEHAEDAQIWLISEVLLKAPTLKKYVTQPHDIRLVWDDDENDWIEIDNEGYRVK